MYDLVFNYPKKTIETRANSVNRLLMAGFILSFGFFSNSAF
jgi:hypothetical protein